MPRVTLKQQWDALKEELRQKERGYAESLFGGTLPSELITFGCKGNIERWDVKCATLSHRQPTYYKGKAPNRNDVSALRGYMANLPEFNPDHVHLSLEIYTDSYRMSRSVSLDTLNAEKWDFLDESKAQAKAAEIKAKRQREQELLAAGAKCQYCGEVREAKDIHYKSIVAAQYRNLTSEPRPYCKDRGCAGYDQMGHEG